MAQTKKKKDEKVFDTTKDWNQYEEGIQYKQNIKLFATVKENYNFFIGKQWEGLQGVDDLPKPVFNFIQPIIRFKLATVMANDTKIIYTPMYLPEEDGDGNPLPENIKFNQMVFEVSEALTLYADTLRENLKLDYHNEMMVKDAAIMGCAFTYWYFNKKKQEVDFDAVDVTNMFPGDVNTTDLQKQPYIIISYRRDVEQLKQEARANMKEHLNELTDDDINNLAGDNETRNESGEFGNKEMTDSGQPTKIACLLKMWRDAETDTIHIQKSVKNFVILSDYDTELLYYPVAGMTWEPNKNSFFGISDVTAMIPNQKFANKMAAMMQLSAMNSAFPKTVYNADMVDTLTNKIGEAIAVHGANSLPINEIVGYITPPQISPDATRLFNAAIDLSKELNAASDAALGTANTTSASGRAILLQMEASATPLETTRRRFYSYMEDVARIWFDLWRVYQGESGKKFSITDEMGNTKIFSLTPQEVTDTKTSVRIDVGPCSRYSEAVVAESLDNLLVQGFIPFEWWVEWIPDSTGMPKNDMRKKIKERNAAQAQNPQATPPNGTQKQLSVSPGAQPNQAKAQPTQQPQKQQQPITDGQIQQLVQAISRMEPAKAKNALSQLGSENAELAAKVLKALPPEMIKQMQAA